MGGWARSSAFYHRQCFYSFTDPVHLTGSKLGCGEGGCGACTVMCSKYSIAEGVEHFAVNACLYPLCAVHGMAVTTVEGIGNTRDRLHPCQVSGGRD